MNWIVIPLLCLPFLARAQQDPEIGTDSSIENEITEYGYQNARLNASNEVTEEEDDVDENVTSDDVFQTEPEHDIFVYEPEDDIVRNENENMPEDEILEYEPKDEILEYEPKDDIPEIETFQYEQKVDIPQIDTFDDVLENERPQDNDFEYEPVRDDMQENDTPVMISEGEDDLKANQPQIYIPENVSGEPRILKGIRMTRQREPFSNRPHPRGARGRTIFDTNKEDDDNKETVIRKAKFMGSDTSREMDNVFTRLLLGYVP